MDRACIWLSAKDGENFEALHNNTGVLFAKADLDGWNAGTTRTLVTPWLFRAADGGMGVIAVRDDGKVLVSFTKDLMEFDGEIFPDLHAEGKVVNPRCSYNGFGICDYLGKTDRAVFLRVSRQISQSSASLFPSVPGKIPSWIQIWKTPCPAA